MPSPSQTAYPLPPTLGGGEAAVEAHEAESDPHPTYTTGAEAATAASAAVTTHESTYAHGNLPTTGQKAALSGTSGTPGSGNKYVTNDDSRLSDGRAPSGGASGDLSGTYPNPTVAKVAGVTPGTTGLALLDDATQGAARTTLGLGTSATLNVPASGDAASGEVVKGSDTRLTDSRAPSGSASGDLSGTYPGPTVTRARGLRESGGTTFAMGAVAEGQVLGVVGGVIVGLYLAGGLVVTPPEETVGGQSRTVVEWVQSATLDLRGGLESAGGVLV